MKLAQKIQVLLLSAGIALSSGVTLPQAAIAELPRPVINAAWLLLEGQKYPVIRSLPIILDRTAGRGVVGAINPTRNSADGRYELVELIGDMSSRSIYSYTGRTAFRKAKVKDTVTGQTMEALLPLIVRYF